MMPKQKRGAMTKTLQEFNEITENIVVGKYVDSPEFIDTLQSQAKCSAILSLQSDQDLDKLDVDFYELQSYAESKSVHLTRVPMNDFDPENQKLVLGEAVYTLTRLIADGHRVYVHCTAGMNRSPLVVLAYLTFCQRMSLDEAHKLLISRRAVSAPPVDVWRGARRKLLERHADTISERLADLASESEADNAKLTAARMEIERDILQSIFKVA